MVVVLALAVYVAVAALSILAVALLLAVLRVVALLVAAIVALLVLWHAICGTIGLTRLEGGCARCKGRSTGAETRLAWVVAQVQLLLGLLGQVLVLGSRVIFPRVEVRHVGRNVV